MPSFSEFLQEKYPDEAKAFQQTNLDHLISDKEIPLSRANFKKIELFIKEIYQISRQPSYQNKLDRAPVRLHSSNQASVLMSYDFHIDQNDQPKLIEVNTNSSGYLIASEIYNYFEQNAFTERESTLAAAFKEEASFFDKPIERCVIVDENPSQQKMWVEFLLYQQFFKKNLSWQTLIQDVKQLALSVEPTFIYNRDTDFYFQSERSSVIKGIYESQQAIISPNPKEYWLLADKNRLLNWSDDQFWPEINYSPSTSLQSILLKTSKLQEIANQIDLWANRKNYFFKPSQMYGSKKTYRGSSLSKTKYLDLLNDPTMIVQEISPPQEITDKNGTAWKYDLRFFVYRDQIQLGIGRIYQGQLTNFKTIGGGFTRIRIV